MLRSLLVALCVTFASPAWASPNTFVIADGARLRARPSGKAKSLGRLAFGTEVERLGPEKGKRKGSLHCAPAKGPWVKVKTGGKTGWLWSPLLGPKPSNPEARVDAILAFRGAEPARYGAFSQLFGALSKACEAAGVEVVQVDPAEPCVKLGPKDAPIASVDLTRSLAAQGQGFVLRRSGEASRFLTPEVKNWGPLFERCGAKPPQPSPLTSSARVLHLAPSRYLCAWHVYDLEARRVRMVGSSEKCPSSITWAPARGVVLYSTEDGLFTDRWPTQEARALPQPGLPEFSMTTDVWIEPKTGRVRIRYVAPAKTETKGAVEVYSAGGVQHAVQHDEDGFGTYYLVDGKVSAKGTEAQQVSLPSWGGPYVAFVAELQGEAWRTLVSAPTLCEAGEVPCERVLGDYGPPRTGLVRTDDLKVACNDGRTDCFAPDAMDKDPRLVQAIGQDPKSEDRDAAGWLAWNKGGLLFRVVFGDTPHAVGPLFACDAGCQTLRVVDTGRGADEGLSVAPRGPFLMVADEYSQKRPRIFRAGSEGPVLTLDGQAYWLPADFAVP